jgi:hypothetical protein
MRRSEGFANYSGVAAFAREILVVNPVVGFVQAYPERRVRFPVEEALNHSVVAVAAAHTFGGR